MLEMALARVVTSAHEIGHTLGIAHNFAASVKDRASVMDYHPTLSLVDGKISYENAYAVGIGDWDKVSVKYACSDFPDGTDETAALNKILDQSVAQGTALFRSRCPPYWGSTSMRICGTTVVRQ